MMASVVADLQRMSLDKEVGVSDLLRTALIVAHKLSIEEFKEWISSELLAVGVGVALTLAGFLAGILLFFYVRMVLRAFRRTRGRLRAS